MKSQSVFSFSFRLFERKYFASRIACLIFMIIWILYLAGGQPPMATFIAIIAIFLFLAQFIYQFSWLNWILGSAMILLSAYFLLSVISEFNEFGTFSKSALSLLIVGGGLSLTGIVLSVLMLANVIRDFIYE